MQPPPQANRPASQESAQAPLEQTNPGAQVFPQAPQLALSEATSTQAPAQTIEAPRQGALAPEPQPASASDNEQSAEASRVVGLITEASSRAALGGARAERIGVTARRVRGRQVPTERGTLQGHRTKGADAARHRPGGGRGDFPEAANEIGLH